MDDVSFTARRGEITALLGPNGSGKSTVMRCLIGFFSPTAGRVLVDGVPVGEDDVAARRRIGYLPENVSLYQDLTVAQYLDFVAGAKGIAGRRARRQAVGEVMERCALGGVSRKLAGTLSKGYRQRVGLAQAILGDPEILVLDEPTVGLDPVQAVELRDLVRSVQGRTVLLSTHVLQEASAMCSRVVILSKGKLIAEDTPDGLARRVEAVTRLRVRVDGGDAMAIAAVLGALRGVARVDRIDDAGPGVAWAVSAAEPELVQRAIAAAVVARGGTLLELTAVPPSLEELFVRLVAGAAA